MQYRDLPIHDMASRHVGLIESIAATWLDAARVCLDRHHVPPVDFDIREADRSMMVVVDWEVTDSRTRYALDNSNDATSWGAYACVLAALERLDGLVAVRRAETETGADYYVAPPGTAPDDLDSCFRLEVSGVDHGDTAEVHRRLRSKLNQLSSGNSNLPAVAGVTGFLAGLVLLSYLEE